MEVTLRYNTPLWVCSEATRQCWDSRDKSDSSFEISGYDADDGDAVYERITGEKDKALIERIGNQHKHKSVLEHLVYTFDIDGISRACLQEVARHRMASYSVKSTRYTLKELKDYEPITIYNFKEFAVSTNNRSVDIAITSSLEWLQTALKAGISNDIAKYCLPEAYKTSLTMTINARSLQNFLELRTSKAALLEIRDLAYALYKALPEEHQYLFTDYLYEEE